MAEPGEPDIEHPLEQILSVEQLEALRKDLPGCIQIARNPRLPEIINFSAPFSPEGFDDDEWDDLSAHAYHLRDGEVRHSLLKRDEDKLMFRKAVVFMPDFADSSIEHRLDVAVEAPITDEKIQAVKEWINGLPEEAFIQS